jgi:hypothetical protein
MAKALEANDNTARRGADHVSRTRTDAKASDMLAGKWYFTVAMRAAKSAAK